MTIDELAELKKIIPPPKMPWCSKGDWGNIQTEWEISLPNNYKQFIEVYGTGSLAREIAIYNFLDPDDLVIVQDTLSRLCEARQLMDERDITFENNHRSFPFPIYPESGGILPWAYGADGWDFLWLTESNSNNWSILISYKNFENYFQYHDTSVPQILIMLFSNPPNEVLQIDSTFIPKKQSNPCKD